MERSPVPIALIMTLQLPTHINRPARPLLSRVAESAYWMSRYVERAEHVARVLMVNINSLLDVGDLDPAVEKLLWLGPLRVFLVEQTPEVLEILSSGREKLAQRVAQYLGFDPSQP